MYQETFGSFGAARAPGERSAASLDAESVLAYLNQVLNNQLQSRDCRPGADSSPVPGPQDDDRKYRELALDFWASQAYAERRLRDNVFNDPEIFGEPAWDALLDIAQAEARGERLAITSACIGSCAPSTTALRWLKILEARGLVRREADVSDARRSFVRLTRDGRKKVELYFQEVKRLRSNQGSS